MHMSRFARLGNRLQKSDTKCMYSMWVTERMSVSACVCVCVLWENVFSNMNKLPLSALDAGIWTVCYHGDWSHNRYHGNMRERQRYSSGCQGD